MTTTRVAAHRRQPPWLVAIRLLRLHFAPVSLAAGLLGMVAAPDSASVASIALGVAVCTLGYGIGQVINDFVDRDADAINAPYRPFVTGELHAARSLAMAGASLAAMLVAAAAVAPALAGWVLVALAGHMLYAATKPLPLVGNLVNGADLASAAALALAHEQRPPPGVKVALDPSQSGQCVPLYQPPGTSASVALCVTRPRYAGNCGTFGPERDPDGREAGAHR